MFGCYSDTLSSIIKATDNSPGVKYIDMIDPQSAGFAAEGYARASGNLGIIVTGSGTHTMSLAVPFYYSLSNSTPILNLSGQEETSELETKGHHAEDATGVAVPVTKHVTSALSVSQLQYKVEEMIQVALGGRKGPVVLEVPEDIVMQDGNYVEKYEVDVHGMNKQFNVDPNQIKLLLDAISESKKPLAFCGHGIIISGAQNEFKEFISKTGIPVAKTLRGVSGFTSDEKLDLGLMGINGNLENEKAVKDADLIIAFGMQINETEKEKLKELGSKARIVHIEIDPASASMLYESDIIVIGDVKQVLMLLNRQVSRGDYNEWVQALEVKKEEKQKREMNSIKIGYGPQGKLLTKTVVTFLSNITNGIDNIVSDAGEHQILFAKFYRFKHFNTWFTVTSKSSKGYSIPASIGVKLARPTEEVWAVTDEVGFQSSLLNLANMMHMNIKVNIIVINSQIDPSHTPDLIRIAGSYGVPGLKIEKLEEIENAIKWARQEKTSALLEFICDPIDYTYPLVEESDSQKEVILNEDDITTLNVKSLKR